MSPEASVEVSVFRRLCFVSLLLFPLAAARGQRIARAAIVAPVSSDSIHHIRSDSSVSLSHDVKRGVVIGSTTGAVVGLAGVAGYVWANSRETCCEQPPHEVRFARILAIEALAAVGGSLVGAVLGYAYHVQ